MKEGELVVCAAIISGVLAGSFGILGAWLGHLWNKKSTNEALEVAFSKAVDFTKIQDFNRAAVQLKAILTEAENWLKFEFPRSDIKVAGKLKEFDPAHPKALMEFRAHIPENRQVEFDRACQKYYYPDPNSDEDRRFFQYALAHISENAHAIALENIKGIFHFTDPKNVF